MAKNAKKTETVEVTQQEQKIVKTRATKAKKAAALEVIAPVVVEEVIVPVIGEKKPKKERKTIGIMVVEPTKELFEAKSVNKYAKEATQPVIERKENKETVLPIAGKGQILPEAFNHVNARMALAMMNVQEKKNPSFASLNEKNIKALENWTDKVLNLTRNKQAIAKEAQRAADDLAANVKRSYVNFGNYYISEALNKGIAGLITEDEDLKAILTWCAGHVRYQIKTGKGFKVFNLHKSLSKHFKPCVTLSKEGVLSSAVIDSLSAFLEKLKAVGDAYNARKLEIVGGTATSIREAETALLNAVKAL